MSGAVAYDEFLAAKRVSVGQRGLSDIPDLNPSLFPFQRDVTEFLLRVGCGAAFLDTGLGKTLIQLDWARVVAEETAAPVLILAPLAVAAQTVREGEKFGIEARVVREQADCGPGINVANYERLHLLDPRAFGGVVLDESSILKSFTGKTTRHLIEAFSATPYRLACTATPAPNDHMELGNHAEFLDAMESNEMLARWFLADQSDMGRYRLKKHAVCPFWDWVASWARCISKPSDLGYSDEGFVLPPLKLFKHEVKADRTTDTNGALFRMPDTSATAIHREKRLTTDERADVIAGLVAAEPDEPWLLWCDTNYEADALVAAIEGAVDVRGNMTPEMKEDRLVGFAEGRVKVLITKPSIAGFGLNFQHCARMAFVGLSFSYEKFYQAVRRCWRFGQNRPVNVHVVMADTERAIWDVVNRKSGDHDGMKREMSRAMKRAMRPAQTMESYKPTMPMTLPGWMTK